MRGRRKGFFPVREDTDDQEHLEFLAANYLAAIEDDEEEDAIWEEYNCCFREGGQNESDQKNTISRRKR